MRDAEILRSQIPTSTDPERLEREAVRAERDYLARLLRDRMEHLDPTADCDKAWSELTDHQRSFYGHCVDVVTKHAGLSEALRHISKLTSFYMDNVLWGQACERARAFVEKMGSPAGAAPLTPDRPSPPATPSAKVSGWQPIETAPKDGTVVLLCGGHDDNLEFARDAAEEALMTAPCRAMWSRGSWLAGLAECGHVGITYQNPTHWQPLPGVSG